MPVKELPQDVSAHLEQFVQGAQDALREDLQSIVLFGSAAAGQLRATSDVNLLLVLSRFDADRAADLSAALNVARAGIQLEAMFVLESELESACDAFAVKFDDIAHRHRVLFGTDPFSGRTSSREALIFRVRQVLLNLQLRLRERHVALGARPEALAHVIADAAPPLRSAAAAILRLEGTSVEDGKAALASIASTASLPNPESLLEHVSHAREQSRLAPGTARETLLGLMTLTNALRLRAQALA